MVSVNGGEPPARNGVSSKGGGTDCRNRSTGPRDTEVVALCCLAISEREVGRALLDETQIDQKRE